MYAYCLLDGDPRWCLTLFGNLCPISSHLKGASVQSYTTVRSPRLFFKNNIIYIYYIYYIYAIYMLYIYILHIGWVLSSHPNIGFHEGVFFCFSEKPPHWKSGQNSLGQWPSFVFCGLTSLQCPWRWIRWRRHRGIFPPTIRNPKKWPCEQNRGPLKDMKR